MLGRKDSGSINSGNGIREMRDDSGKEKIEESKVYLENLSGWRMDMLDARRDALESGDFFRMNRLKQERPRPSF